MLFVDRFISSNYIKKCVNKHNSFTREDCRTPAHKHTFATDAQISSFFIIYPTFLYVKLN